MIRSVFFFFRFFEDVKHLNFYVKKSKSLFDRILNQAMVDYGGLFAKSINLDWYGLKNTSKG